MNPIRAFVGHSFTAEDEAIVQSFLNYFSSIGGLGIGFEWDHAQAAEPLDLMDKVLKLTKDKNLFIGICTSKERAIANKNLRRSKLFFTNRFFADEQAIESKTSDWIIQEIGFAVGRGMDLLLLVESGVRKPGGLQGNLEYISFERNAPERSFPKILEMIKSLLSKTGGTTTQTQELTLQVQPPAVPAQPQLDGKEKDFFEPKIDWDLNDYDIAMFRAIHVKRSDIEERIYEAFIRTTDGRDPKKKAEFDSSRAYWRMVFVDGSGIENLERMAEEQPGNSKVLANLAAAYRHFDDHPNAGATYIKAAKTETDIASQISYLALAVPELIKADQSTLAAEKIEEIKAISLREGNLEANALRAILGYADAINDNDLYVGIGERILEASPGELDARFSLAYRYGEMGNNTLAALHYSKIPINGRSPAAWNNLGVALGNLKLPIKSVEMYRNSEKKGETLAMSNLARMFLKAGFSSEARALCENALKIADYDKNVPETLVNINDEIEREGKSWSEIEQDGEKLRSFLTQFGRAASEPLCSNHSGTWNSPRCDLHFTIKGSLFAAYGTYTIENSALASVFAGISPSHKEKRVMRISMSGRIFGRAVVCEIKFNEEGKSLGVGTSLLIEDNEKLLLALTPDFDNVFTYEPKAPKGNRYYSMKLLSQQ